MNLLKEYILPSQENKNYNTILNEIVESEKKLKNYMRNIPHALSEIDTLGNIKFSNKKHHQLLEYNPDELIGRTILDLQTSESEKDNLREYLLYLTKERPSPTPWTGTNRTKNGKILNVKVEWDYIINPEGKITGFSSVILDTTSELKTYRDLQESEKKYRNLVENSIEGIGIYDNHKIHFANKALLEMFEYDSLEEFMSIPVKNHLAKESQNIFKQKRTNGTLIQHPPAQYQYKIITKKGTNRILEVAPAEIEINGRKFIQSTFIDITETWKTTESLNIYKHIVLSSSDQIAFLDSSLKILAVNTSFLEIFSLLYENTIDHKIYEILPESTFLKTVQEYSQRCFLGEEIHSLIWNDTEEGKPELFDISMFPYRGDGSGISGVTMRTKNVTQELRLEMEILNIGEKERKQIGIELHDGLSHELLGIAIKSKILAQKLAEHNQEDASAAGEIEIMINKAINEIRNIAQGLFPVNMVNASFDVMIQQTIINLEENYNISCTAQIDKNIKIPDQRIAVNLYHILQESVVNIIKHSKASRVEIKLEEKKQFLTMTVNDNGVGLNRKKRQNHGMGLHIMQYRANLIGAMLNLRNNKSGGTELICRLHLTNNKGGSTSQPGQ